MKDGLVERVARKIDVAQLAWSEAHPDLPLAAMPREIIARAAIQEMREPTEEMHDAGAKVIAEGQGNPHTKPLPTLRNAYTAMIDAALSE